MKLKYKKMIILISMCTMGIGLVTFSLNGKSKSQTTEVESSAPKIAANVTKGADTAETADNGTEQTQDAFSAALPTATPIPTATPSPEPTVVPNPLQKDANKQVNALIKEYFKAKLSGKLANFKGLVNSVKLVNITAIRREVKYIQKYANIHCYTKNGPTDGSYAVYVYYESKFKNIDTPAPGMVEFYVKTNKDGDLYIYMGKIDKETEQYLSDARNSDDTMEVIYKVNEKYKAALEKDSALGKFNSKLEESAKSASKSN